MRAKKRWAATFDGANCRVYAVHGERLEPQDFAVTAGPRKLDVEGEQGRAFQSFGEGRSKMEPHSDLEHVMEKGFVNAVTAELEAKAAAGDFDELVILAEPRALGAFREAASPHLMERVIKQVPGNYVNQPDAHLVAAIRA